MAGGGSTDSDAPFGEKFLALIIVVVCATIGGFIFKIM